MEIVKIVKYLQKDNYANFLAEICSIHYFQNRFLNDNYFLKNQYFEQIIKKYNLQDEHKLIIQNLNLDSPVLANTEYLCFFHYNFTLHKPCTLRFLLQSIITLLENYDPFVQEIYFKYDEKNLIMTCRYEFHFITTIFIHYIDKDILPIIAKYKISCINHLFDLIVDNVLYAKKTNGELPIRIIYTVYDLDDNKFLQTNSPFDYEKILENHYYSPSSLVSNITDGITNIRL